MTEWQKVRDLQEENFTKAALSKLNKFDESHKNSKFASRHSEELEYMRKLLKSQLQARNKK